MCTTTCCLYLLLMIHVHIAYYFVVDDTYCLYLLLMIHIAYYFVVSDACCHMECCGDTCTCYLFVVGDTNLFVGGGTNLFVGGDVYHTPTTGGVTFWHLSYISRLVLLIHGYLSIALPISRVILTCTTSLCLSGRMPGGIW